jgi:hypothetical protein
VDLDEQSVTTYEKRITESARRVADLRQQEKMERARRDTLILEALDLGYEPKRVAKAAGRSVGRIRHILGGDNAVDDDTLS